MSPMNASDRSSCLVKSIRLLLTLGLPTAALAQTANLTVNATSTVRTVDERVFGVNSVMWDGNTNTAQTISMVQAAGIRMIRMPGGSNSDTYHWRVNKSEGAVTNGVLNTWTWKDAGGVTGFGSFINLFTNASAQPMITVNYGSGTPQEAAGLVAYLNASVGSSVAIGGFDGPADNFAMQNSGYWAVVRAGSPLATDDGMNFLRIGRTSPVGAEYFEIGNECYGSWEYDQQAVAHDPTTYANRVQQYITAMKAVDPTIKIGVVVVTSPENKNYNNWTPTMLAQLKTLGVTPDFVIYHLYPQAPFAESDAALLQVSDSGSNSWGSIATDLRAQVNTNLGATVGAGVEIIVTENNCVYAQPGKQSTNLVNGLYLADNVGNLMQTEINGYMWWALRNGTPTINNAGVALDGNMSSSLYGWRLFGDYGMLSSVSSLTGETTAYDAYPTYYTMKLLSNFARGGDTVVKATSDNTLLSVYAAKSSTGTVRLLVINKDPGKTFNASVALQNYTPPASASVYTYGITQDNAAKSGSGSTDIATSFLTISGATFSASFAPYSATVISLDGKTDPSAPTTPSTPSTPSTPTTPTTPSTPASSGGGGGGGGGAISEWFVAALALLAFARWQSKR